MKKVKVYNISKNSLILEAAEMADTFSARLKGLLGRKNLDEGTGLIIVPCNSVHMIGMKFCIDVIFVGNDNEICHIINSMKKMKVSPVVNDARYVIEAPAGTAERLNLELKDRIKIMD